MLPTPGQAGLYVVISAWENRAPASYFLLLPLNPTIAINVQVCRTVTKGQSLISFPWKSLGLLPQRQAAAPAAEGLMPAAPWSHSLGHSGSPRRRPQLDAGVGEHALPDTFATPTPWYPGALG